MRETLAHGSLQNTQMPKLSGRQPLLDVSSIHIVTITELSHHFDIVRLGHDLNAFCEVAGAGKQKKIQTIHAQSDSRKIAIAC